MRTRSLLPFLLLAAVAVSGCSTPSSRIREKSSVFAALAPADQQRLRQGTVAVGDTPDMVYIALGEPSRRSQTTTAGGHRMEWRYREYSEDYEGSHFAGYSRRVAVDPRTGQRYVYLQPRYVDVYTETAEDRLRIVFENGRVVAIEELKE